MSELGVRTARYTRKTAHDRAELPVDGLLVERPDNRFSVDFVEHRNHLYNAQRVLVYVFFIVYDLTGFALLFAVPSIMGETIHPTGCN